MKKLKISGELPKWDTEIQSDKMLLEKWCQQACSMQGCHRPSICKKRKKKKATFAKHNKEKYIHTKKCACQDHIGKLSGVCQLWWPWGVGLGAASRRWGYIYIIMTDSTDMNLSKLLEIVKDREAWSTAVHDVAKSQTRLSDWTTANDWFTLLYGENQHNSVKQLSCKKKKEWCLPG